MILLRGNQCINAMQNLALNDQKAVKMLTKLLRAARRAHEEGKSQALSKIIDEASKLSFRLNENLYKLSLDNIRPATSFYREYLARKQSKNTERQNDFVRVIGEIIED